MASKKFYTTKELIDLVESEDFWKADVFITPPNDGQDSEEDSDDDESPTADANHLSGRQLEAEASAKIHNADGIVYIGEELNTESDSEDGWESEDNIPLARLSEKARKPVERDWTNRDLTPSFPDFVSPQATPDKIYIDAIECFETFIDAEICLCLKDMFELYARQKGDHSFQTTVEEIKCFIAILYVSGHLQVPRWRMLWEVDTDTYNPLVANAMRRNRFDTLKKYCHCADNTNLPLDDKFAKVRALFDMLNQRFLNHALLKEKLSIDESMVPYFGRHGTKQCIRSKPIRYGYKIWSLCDPSGYLIQFDPYQGKQTNRQNMELGVGGSVVMKLLSKLPQGVPFKIYGDRFFSSLKLVNGLQKVGYGYTGTILPNRTEKCPLASKDEVKKTPRGSYKYLTDKTTEITITSWNDNRPVLTVSSCDPVNPIGQVHRWISTEKKKLPVPQPFVIGQYNKNMGGVDRMDQNINNYRINIRSKKWWWALFAFCLDSSIHNAWQSYRSQPDRSKIDFLKFRREITHCYLKKYGKPVVGGGRPKSSKSLSKRVHGNLRYDGLNHWMIPAHKQGRCAFCHKNTTKMCEKCEVNLHEQCFKPFHVL